MCHNVYIYIYIFAHTHTLTLLITIILLASGSETHSHHRLIAGAQKWCPQGSKNRGGHHAATIVPNLSLPKLLLETRTDQLPPLTGTYR